MFSSLHSLSDRVDNNNAVSKQRNFGTTQFRQFEAFVENHGRPIAPIRLHSTWIVLADARRASLEADTTATTAIRCRLNAPVDALMEMHKDIRMIRSAVNDIAKVNVTSGEIEAIQVDLNRLQ